MATFREADVVPPIEFSILRDTRPDGRIIGTYQDHPISEAVIDEFGRRYVYTGLAPRFPSGRFNGEALDLREFIVLPGLAYRLEAEPRRRIGLWRKPDAAAQPHR